MVHSEHILISISTTQNLYKKCLTIYIYRLYRFFFQNYPCQRQRFLNVHLNNEVVLIPLLIPSCEWGSPRISFFFLICIKMVYLVRILRKLTHVFTIEKFYEKNVSHSTYIYMYIHIDFHFIFQKLLCIMKHYCDINESGFKFHFYSLF